MTRHPDKKCNHARCEIECLRPPKGIKRTPLKRSAVKIKKKSDKMKVLDVLYLKMRKSFMKENPVCMAKVECKGAPSTDVHHKAGKVGKLYLDSTLWLAACRSCHIAIETKPRMAKQLNLSVSRLNKRG